MTTELAVIVPGDVDAPTGGNVYDRRLCAALAGLGFPVAVHRVNGAWPRPDTEARYRLERLLAAQPDGHLVLGDGLVVCAAPGAVVPHARRLRLVALIHLPLAEETGLDPDEARRLAEAEARTLAACRAVVVTGSWAAEAVRAVGVPADRVHLVEPGTDRPQARGPVRGSPEGGRLLCLASLTPRKGQHLLVEALAGLAGLPWTCRLVGPVDRAPAYAAEVRASVHRHGLAERLVVTGPLDGPDLESVWRDTDLLVLPSLAETYGMVVAEALVRGVPVLTTSGGGAERTAAGAALVVPAGDAQALRLALARWLGDPDLRADLRRRAATAGRSLPSWDDAARRLRDVLEAVDADHGQVRGAVTASGTFDADWLALREPADHVARDQAAGVLLPTLDAAFDRALPAGRPPTMLDLGCGTGSDVRWLAPRLSRPQHWVLVDHDAALLRHAVEALAKGPAAVLSVTARAAGLADLAEPDLAGVHLLATSALLDLLTGPELDHLVGVCVATRTPLLAALSVTGEVHLDPPSPLDQQLATAFDAHQRRPVGEVPRLGPDAAASAALAFDGVGWRVTTAETPWVLGAEDGPLTTAWLDGWVRAAVEQQPGLEEQVAAYLDQRAGQIAAGELVVRVGHRDLLALPPAGC